LQKEELNFLKKKKDKQLEKEMFYNESDIEQLESKLVKILDDRVVITVHINVQGYLQYTLDAQLDTGAMNSCAKYGALPSYYWQPVDISFRVVNKTELKIKYIAPDFPIYLQEEKVPVTLYCFDTGADILLGQDFVNKCLPCTIGNNFVQFTISGNTVKVLSKSTYETRIAVKQSMQEVEKYASSLIKIQKIIGHDEKHGMDMIKDIKEKIESDCTSDYPNAFWTREQYFVSLPYKEDYTPRPQKASANHMSPTECEYCQKEISELLERKLIEVSRSP
jgi:hypothetical protein